MKTGRSLELDSTNSEDDDADAELDGMASELDNPTELDDAAIAEVEDATSELDAITELEDISGAPLEERTVSLDVLDALELEKIADELDTVELDVFKELDETATELDETSDEEDSIEELDNSAELELDKTRDEDELMNISTLKVTYSLSEDSAIFESAIFTLSPFQKTNLLNSVTLPAPGKGSSAVAYLLFSGTASIISTYM